MRINKLWGVTEDFKKIDNPIWKKYKGNNGFFQKYFFLAHILVRGKSHPQKFTSMLGEYAFLVMFLSWLGIVPTVKVQVAGVIIITIALLIIGFLDVYYEVNRKESSFTQRFNPEYQQLFKQVDQLHKKMVKEK